MLTLDYGFLREVIFYDLRVIINSLRSFLELSSIICLWSAVISATGPPLLLACALRTFFALIP